MKMHTEHVHEPNKRSERLQLARRASKHGNYRIAVAAAAATAIGLALSLAIWGA